jgi:hypothetical protein
MVICYICSRFGKLATLPAMAVEGHAQQNFTTVAFVS